MQKSSDPRISEPMFIRSSFTTRSSFRSSTGRYSELALDSDINYEVFVWPKTKNPTIFDYIFYVPLNMVHFLKNLSRAFGWRYVFMVCMVYGLQQGLGNAWFFQARDYYFKDVANLQPAEAQANTAAAHTPWNIKPLYGMLSDIVSVNGLNRTPYIAVAGMIGASSYSALFVIPVIVTLAVVFMFGVNLSVSSPDVMIDADIAEKCKLYPKFASDLQALCWSSMALFSVIGFGTSGVMITYVGPRLTFGVLIISSCLVFIPAIMGFLGETKQRAHPSRRLGDNCVARLVEVNTPLYKQHQKIFRLAIFVSCCAISMSVVVLATTIWMVRFVVILSIAITVACSVYIANKDEMPQVANIALFIFLRESLAPDLETAMFYWYTDSDNGPHFSPVFVGVINMIGYFAMFVGIAVYNKYMSTWQYRTLFARTQVALALVSLIDIFIISRENKRLGIPDEAMVMGDVTLSPMVRRFIMMPIFVLASKACPDGAEATVYALLMALSNFGNTVAIYFGAFLVYIFGVTDDDYSNFIYVVMVKSFCRLLPIVLIPLLIPEGSPQEPEDFLDGTAEAEKADGDDELNREKQAGLAGDNPTTYSAMFAGLLTTSSSVGSGADVLIDSALDKIHEDDEFCGPRKTSEAIIDI